MHPAPSVIVFTSLSGLGFGLMAWLGFGFPDVSGTTAFWFFFIAYALSVGGLIASVFHLGTPLNAIKSFRQWRSSWLSREGIMAVVSLLVMAVYAIGLIFFEQRLQIFGWLGATFSLVTIYTTSMIYGQMKTVPRWRMSLTPVLFLLYAVAGGALLSAQVLAAALLLAALTVIQYLAWQIGDGRFEADRHTIETATGLGHLGNVRLLESPHSSPNYLMKEMVHVVGRKHAQKLRMISIVLLGMVPAVILMIVPFSHMFVGLAVLSHIVGVFITRWLFFAEAEHVVGLYYDKR